LFHWHCLSSSNNNNDFILNTIDSCFVFDLNSYRITNFSNLFKSKWKNLKSWWLGTKIQTVARNLQNNKWYFVLWNDFSLSEFLKRVVGLSRYSTASNVGWISNYSPHFWVLAKSTVQTSWQNCL
jgi:hypothetical protein